METNNINNMDGNGTSPIPRRHRGEGEKPRDRFFKLRNVLNIIFMLGAVVGVVLFYFSSHAVGTFVLLCSIIFKIAECCLRLLR